MSIERSLALVPQALKPFASHVLNSYSNGGLEVCVNKATKEAHVILALCEYLTAKKDAVILVVRDNEKNAAKALAKMAAARKANFTIQTPNERGGFFPIPNKVFVVGRTSKIYNKPINFPYSLIFDTSQRGFWTNWTVVSKELPVPKDLEAAKLVRSIVRMKKPRSTLAFFEKKSSFARHMPAALKPLLAL